MKVVAADTGALPFQSRTDAAVVRSGFGPIVQHGQMAAKILHGGEIASGVAAFLGTEHQFGQRDRRDGHVPRMPVEGVEHAQGFSLDHIDDDVGVKQVLEHGLQR